MTTTRSNEDADIDFSHGHNKQAKLPRASHDEIHDPRWPDIFEKPGLDLEISRQKRDGGEKRRLCHSHVSPSQKK